MITLVEDDVNMYYGELTGAKMKVSGYGFAQYKKYTNHDIVIKEAKGRSGKNLVVNRLADVYLMYAECLVQKGDFAGAREYINAVRSRWGLKRIAPDVAQADEDQYDYMKDAKYDTQEGLMEHLMYVERPLELSVEGYQTRWQDMKRWGITTARYQQLADETYYLHDYKALKVSGKTKKLKLSQINLIPNLDSSGNPVAKSVVDYEYDKVVENIAVMKMYFDIPTNEVQNNTNVNL